MDLVKLSTTINALLGVYPTGEQAQQIADSIMPKKGKPVVVVEVSGGLVQDTTVLNGDAEVEVFDWDSIEDSDNMVGRAGDEGYTREALARAEDLPTGDDRDRIVAAINDEIAKYEEFQEQEQRETEERKQREITKAKELLRASGETL